MADRPGTSWGLPDVFTSAATSSFSEFLGQAAPDLLPGRRPLPPGVTAGAEIGRHGTTIVAVTFAGGVLMAGDRRATMGNLIAQRDIEKVFLADAYSLVGVAGMAGIGSEIVRLFRTELEHYEKIEGTPLTLDGKANRLAMMIRANLGAAMQGLAAVPLFAGFDLDAPDPQRAGRIYSFDVVGGCYEERDFHHVGSGSAYARGSLKKRWRADADAGEATRVAVEALYDAADDDTATGGPDPSRRLFPTVRTVTADGVRQVPDDEVAGITESIVAARTANPA